MMRKLKEDERETMLGYISAEPEQSLFIFGDVEVYGMDGDVVELFCEDMEDGGYDFILLRYTDNYIIYSHHSGFNSQHIADFLQECNAQALSGKEETVLLVAKLLPQWTGSSDYLSRLRFINGDISAAIDNVLMLSSAQADEVYDLLEQIEEFTSKDKARDKAIAGIRQNLVKGGHAFGIVVDGRLVSVAQTTAESSVSAMLVGVATLPKYRENGFAMACVQKAAQYCFDNKKQFICLFYDNPAAGELYHKCGFEDIGKYMLLHR